METAIEREDHPSQANNSLLSQTQRFEQENENPESWEDILNHSLHGFAETGKGMGRFTKAYLSSPLYFSLGLAQGFQ